MHHYEKSWDGKPVHRRFDTLGDFLEFSEGPTDLEKGSRYSITNATNTQWDSGVGLVDSYRLAREGWRDGADKISQLSEKILDKIGRATGNQVAATPAVDGGAWVDVARYLSGEPEHFYRFEENIVSKRVIEIGMSVCASGAIPGQTILNRGAAVLAAIVAMEQKGYSVGLTVDETANYKTTLTHEVCVKVPGEILDVDRLAFVCTHPAFLRRICFAASEREPSELREAVGVHSGSYGSPMDSIEKEKFDFYLPCMRGAQPNFKTEDAAYRWVMGFLAKYGITGNE